MNDIEKLGQVHRIESMEGIKYPYDAIFVLGGGLQKVGDKYYPTDYSHSDEFGMLGGGIRVIAALDLYLQKQSREFVFTTGIYEKNRAKFGQDVPPESHEYAATFKRLIEDLKKRPENQEKFKDMEEPLITSEDRSTTTLTNIREALQIILDSGWKKVAFVSNEYHIPRIEALYKQALEKHPEVQVNVSFIPAETIVKEAEPGKYDEEICKAYCSEEAKKRIINEIQGIEDLEAGKYALEEFQLEKKNR